MDKEEKMKVLKNYLGEFYTRISKDDLKLYKNSITQIKDSYYCSDMEELKRIAMFILLFKGNINYKVYNAYDIFSIYIGNDENTKVWVDLVNPLIFIYYPLNITENKKTEELILHVITCRKLKNLFTVVLSEKVLPLIESYFNNTSKTIKLTNNLNTSILNKPKSKTDSIF